MVEPDIAAAIAELAGHPYVLVPSPGDPSTATRLTGPLPVAELLDLGFGAADALVEVHSRGLAVDGLHAGNLVTVASGEPRLALESVRPAADAADQAADVSALRHALAGLLTDDEDPATLATRTVLADDTPHTAAALRDALAAVRLGTPAPRPPLPSTAAEKSNSPTGTERTAGGVDSAQRLHARPGAPGPDASAGVPAERPGRRVAAWPLLLTLVVLLAAIGLWALRR